MQKYHLPKKIFFFSCSSSSFSSFLSVSSFCKRNLILEINFFSLSELMSLNWLLRLNLCMIILKFCENVCEFDETLDYNFTHIGKLHTAKFSDFPNFFLLLSLLFLLLRKKNGLFNEGNVTNQSQNNRF